MSKSPHQSQRMSTTKAEEKKNDSEKSGETLEEWRQRFEPDCVRLLVAEYMKLKITPVGVVSAAFHQNPILNRYNNIQLLENTRVLLNDGLQPTYIHANRVDGYQERGSCILTQAPPSKAIKDYWRMVWRERAQVVVCLTSLKEKGSQKADLFFPTSSQQPFRAGPLRLLLIDVKEMPSPHRVCILHMRIYCWFGRKGRERDVAMVFYGEWPDRGVPSNPASFLELLVAVDALRQTAFRQKQRSPSSKKVRPPMIVNCSAGVGRSATFVACQIEIDRYRNIGLIDPESTVRRLRDQRAGAVQNWIQYAFICRVVLEAMKRFGQRTPSKPATA